MLAKLSHCSEVRIETSKRWHITKGSHSLALIIDNDMLSDCRNRKREGILYWMYLCQEIYSQRRNSVRCFSVIHDRSVSTQNCQRISPACRDQCKCLPQPQTGIELNLEFHHRASLTNTRAAF